MFERKRPCSNCPFRKGMGSFFRLPRARLDEIMDGPAFQCHKTIDYDQFDDDRARQGDTPQQCAGLMAVLHAENAPNQIMQVALRLTDFSLNDIELDDAYPSKEAVYSAHEGQEP